MHDIVPHFLDMLEAGTVPGNQLFSQFSLRPGEVVRLLPPEDPENSNKKFTEYDVYVYHREDGTITGKICRGCLLASAFGGAADFTYWTLRPGQAGEAGKDAQPGSWVVVQCLNGEATQALIVGGLRDDRDDDLGRQDRGHHAEFVFNGVTFAVEKDGSWSITRGGATGGDGDPLDSDKEEARGTKIQVLANGNVVVTTPEAKQTLTLDHEAGTVRLQGDTDLTLHGSKVHIGTDADEKAVLGDTLVDLLTQLVQALETHNHPHPLGPTGPPLQVPIFAQIRAKWRTVLSNFIFVKKDP